jgi:hypothetical protein
MEECRGHAYRYVGCALSVKTYLTKALMFQKDRFNVHKGIGRWNYDASDHVCLNHLLSSEDS